MIDELVSSLTSLLPTGLDLEHLREPLLSGMNSRLMGEVTKESYSYRHSIFASSAGIEEVANIILTIVKNANLENKTLGQRLVQRQTFDAPPVDEPVAEASIDGGMVRLVVESGNNPCGSSIKRCIWLQWGCVLLGLTTMRHCSHGLIINRLLLV
jgi:hypothetical protein